LGREVALKEIQTGHAADAVSRGRFVREAEITGGLEHPGVVPVYGLGRYDDGRPYYAMRFIRGESLQEAIKKLHTHQEGYLLRGLLTRFIAACNAIAYAHSRGVIHRDIKPSNVMLGPYGETLVVDWGLAKVIGRESADGEDSAPAEATLRPPSGESSATQAGSALGTPAFMSPEQARGEVTNLGPATDIYSLGATLYTLLTGRPPIQGRSTAELLENVRLGNWKPARQLQANVPKPLEAIASKALALKAGERYGTALELAGDVERWLADLPVTAYRDPLAARLWRWGRRHKPLVASAVVLLLTGVLGLALGLVFLGRANAQIQHERDQVEQQHSEAVTSLYHSLVHEALAIRRARDVGYRAEVYKRLEQALQLATPDLDRQELRQEAVACLGDFVGLDFTSWDDLPSSHTRWTLHPDGEQIAVGLANGTIQVRRIPSGEITARMTGHKVEVTALGFRGDGDELISGDIQGAVKIWKRQGPDEWTCTKSFRSSGGIYWGGLSSDGKCLFTNNFRGPYIVQTDLSDGKAIARLAAPGAQTLLGLALSPDGKLLVAGSIEKDAGNQVLVWDVATGKVARKLSPGLDTFRLALFSPNGKLLACVHTEGIALYDTSTFEERLFVRGDFPYGAAFSPDSQILAFRGQHRLVIRLWNIATNREIATLPCPEGLGLVFSKSGRYLLAGTGRTIRIWHHAGADDKRVLPGHSGGIADVVFSPDGRRLCTAGKDHKIKIWDPATGTLIREVTEAAAPFQTLAYSADGRILAAGHWGAETLRFYDAASWQPVASIQSGLGSILMSVGFSPDGRCFAAGGSRGLKLWRVRQNSATGPDRPSLELEQMAQLSNEFSSSICFSPDGRLLASAEGSFTKCRIRIWDVQTAQPRTAPTSILFHAILIMGFSPDSKRLVFVNQKPEIEIWDIAQEQQAFSFGEKELQRRGALPPHTRLSGDGAWYAIGGPEPSIWDLENKKLLLALPGEPSAAWCVAWSPNKEQLAVGTADGGLVVWNLPGVRKNLAEIGLDW
jgi:WD40 repeat protein/tRNA A-37 threonylcarbamoyl transferase component Bud32